MLLTVLNVKGVEPDDQTTGTNNMLLLYKMLDKLYPHIFLLHLFYMIENTSVCSSEQMLKDVFNILDQY